MHQSPLVLQRMHQSSAPCSIHRQLSGSSILKVTGVNFPVSDREKKRKGKRSEGKGKMWHLRKQGKWEWNWWSCGKVLDDSRINNVQRSKNARIQKKGKGVKVSDDIDGTTEMAGKEWRKKEKLRDRTAVRLGHARWLCAEMKIIRWTGVCGNDRAVMGSEATLSNPRQEMGDVLT